jgi:hypothetical protein
VSASKIAILIDENFSQEKVARMHHLIDSIRNQCHLVTIQLPRSESTIRPTLNPNQLAERLHSEGFTLILAPLKIYFSWKSQVDAREIQDRFGRIWAGYSIEPFNLTSTPESTQKSDTRILDFSKISKKSLGLLIQSLAQPTLRSGLSGLVSIHETLIYCENWQNSIGLGLRMDQVLSLPEIAGTSWKKRTHSIRILILSLWSFFEENHLEKAYFQITANSDLLALRLTFQNPNDETPLKIHPYSLNRRPSPIQSLITSSHFFRAHAISADSQKEAKIDYEITTGLLESISEGGEEDQNQLLWIDTMHPRWVLESLNEAPSPKSPWLRVLPPLTLTQSGPQRSANKKSSSKLDEVLEEFQKHFLEAQYEIHQIERKIVDLTQRRDTQEDLKKLKLRMEELTHRENQWIKDLSHTLSQHPKTAKPGKRK